MNKDQFDKLFPFESVGPYDLGKHWPESGDYDKWLAAKIEDFKQGYEYLGHETFSTNSGGTLLLAFGVTRKHFDGLMNGTDCFVYPCSPGTSFASPDELAIHLIDRHGWDTDKATVWLREQVEPKSFNEEA